MTGTKRENTKLYGGLDYGLATLIFTFIGLLCFIPGLMIVMKQHKKPKEQKSTTWLITGFALMGIGMTIGMGMGIYCLSKYSTP